jgi:predicted TIM-barrel fold metal-dependent hydrolase
MMVSMTHPVYRGPVIDAHTHFDAGAVAAADAVLAAPDLPEQVLNFWDLTWPPPAFPDWRATWEARRARGMGLLHMPDISAVGRPGFADGVVAAIAEARGLGAAGIKMWKNLGLSLQDADGVLLAIDDPRLDPLWAAAAEHDLPVAIHIGDPPAFFAPLDEDNERIEELRGRPEYWFGDPARFPPLADLQAAFERVVARHRATTFVGLHFGCFMPLADVARMLDEYPNYSIDTATRTFDLGRPAFRDDALAIFDRWPDRIIFGTDLIRTGVYDLPAIRGAAGDPAAYYDHHLRFFETTEMLAPPFAFLPSDWTLRGLGLGQEQLGALYYDNARRLFRAI